MPSNITEVSTWTTPVTVPSAGDARTAASVNGAFQALANRTTYLSDRALDDGALVGGATAYNTGADANIYVGPIEALTLGGVTARTAGVTTVATSGLVTNTWYYVYAYLTGGAVAFEVSTTAPDAALVFKTGDATRRYVCCFVAKTYTATVYPAPFRKAGRAYYYDFSARAAITAGGLGYTGTSHPSGSAGSWLNIPFDAWVPPHARVALAHVQVGGNNGGSYQIRAAGAPSYHIQVKALGSWADPSDTADLWMPVPLALNGSSVVSADAYSSTTGASLSFNVKGFEE